MDIEAATILFACPISRTSHELDPLAYIARSCPDCGHMLVLAGGRQEGASFLWCYGEVRCSCGRAFLQADVPAYAEDLTYCPACGQLLAPPAITWTEAESVASAP